MSWIETFEWESEAQRKGYLGFVKWAKDQGLPYDDIRPIDLFFLQKDHESTEWMVAMCADQINGLRDSLMPKGSASHR